MQNFMLPPDIVLLAKTVWLLAGGEAAEAQGALTWVIRNRADLATRYFQAHRTDHPLYGDGSFQDACWSVLDDEGTAIFTNSSEWAPFTNQAFSRVLANVWLVCHGDIPDPTAGAVRFHRHDQSPYWSKNYEPSALMGRRIYYQETENIVPETVSQG